MKRLLVGDSKEELLSTLEVILKHWGYRVVLSSCPEQLGEFLHATSPDLIIMGSSLLVDADSPLVQAVAKRISTEHRPLIVLRDRSVEDSRMPPHEILEVPVDVFALFELIQKHIEQHPRRNLRLTVQLPGMFSAGGNSQFAEVLSISSRGLFIRTGVRLTKGDRLRVTIPLLGLKQEVDLDTRVLYSIDPTPRNNYLQGAGIEFTPMDGAAELRLRRFIEYCFLRELSASRRADELDPEQLKNTARG